MSASMSQADAYIGTRDVPLAAVSNIFPCPVTACSVTLSGSSPVASP